MPTQNNDALTVKKAHLSLTTRCKEPWLIRRPYFPFPFFGTLRSLNGTTGLRYRKQTIAVGSKIWRRLTPGISIVILRAPRQWRALGGHRFSQANKAWFRVVHVPETLEYYIPKRAMVLLHISLCSWMSLPRIILDYLFFGSVPDSHLIPRELAIAHSVPRVCLSFIFWYGPHHMVFCNYLFTSLCFHTLQAQCLAHRRVSLGGEQTRGCWGGWMYWKWKCAPVNILNHPRYCTLIYVQGLKRWSGLCGNIAILSGVVRTVAKGDLRSHLTESIQLLLSESSALTSM